MKIFVLRATISTGKIFKIVIHCFRVREKERKSERRMPRLPEATKDVVSCEKARGSANRN